MTAAAGGSEPEVRLRPATPEDEAFQLELYASSREAELARVVWEGGTKEAFLRQQFAAQSHHYRENYPGATLDVVEVDGARAGRLFVARWTKEIRIMDIALLPELRGRGIGTRLLRELQDEARAAGKSLSIHVEAFNPARHLYERLGFAAVGETGVYLKLAWNGATPG